MKDSDEEKRWILCPWCGAKTRLQIFRATELKTFPLFCPKCRHESIINAKNFIIETNPASQTLRRSADRKADHVLRLIFERNASGRLRDRYLYQPPEAEQRLTRVLLKIQADKIIDKR